MIRILAANIHQYILIVCLKRIQKMLHTKQNKYMHTLSKRITHSAKLTDKYFSN